MKCQGPTRAALRSSLLVSSRMKWHGLSRGPAADSMRRAGAERSDVEVALVPHTKGRQPFPTAMLPALHSIMANF